MATDSYKLGPGTLTLDDGGADEIEVAAQLSNCRIEPSEDVTEGDDLNLLDGTTLAGEDDVSRSYVLAGTAVQDLNATTLTPAGFTDWSWDNKGEEVAFTFIPVTARGAAVGVTGTVRVIPLQVGGDAKIRNTADFSWVIIGEPTFTPDSTP